MVKDTINKVEKMINLKLIFVTYMKKVHGQNIWIREMHMVNLTSGKILSLIYIQESVSKAKLVKMIKTDNIHC